MDILRTWIDADTKRERARLYRNIDPKSITIVGIDIYFAHPGTYRPGGSSDGMYRVPLAGCPYITTDPEQIKAYFAEHPNHDGGVCVTTFAD